MNWTHFWIGAVVSAVICIPIARGEGVNTGKKEALQCVSDQYVLFGRKPSRFVMDLCKK